MPSITVGRENTPPMSSSTYDRRGFGKSSQPSVGYDCDTFDFRADLPKIDVPVLVMHGSADRVLPIEARARLTHESIEEGQYVVLDGAPHGLCWTHAD